MIIYVQHMIHRAAILKNGCHFFPAAYRQGRPHRSGAGMSPEHAHTQEPFTTAHVSKPMETWVLPPGYYENTFTRTSVPSILI